MNAEERNVPFCNGKADKFWCARTEARSDKGREIITLSNHRQNMGIITKEHVKYCVVQKKEVLLHEL